MPATRYFPSDVRNKTQKRNDERCEFISEHYLAFAVSLMLEMMMKRRHEKNSLFRPSEMQNLNYNGYARQDEHYAHNRNKERISAENTYRSDKSAERKRTSIAHKNARFERVEKQKSDYSARKRNA